MGDRRTERRAAEWTGPLAGAGLQEDAVHTALCALCARCGVRSWRRLTMARPSATEEFFFDLRGFSILKNALSRDELAQINGWVAARAEALQSIEPGQQIDGLPTQSYYSSGSSIDDGVNIQHVFEVEGWGEHLIDHPSWFGRVQHYLGSFTPFIHELFINLRGPGGYIGCHSGGPRFDENGRILASRWGAAVFKDEETEHDEFVGQGSHRGHHVAWGVPYISMIIALEDIGPGDGATVLVPGSHKSLVGHPFQQQMTTEGGLVEGTQEMHLNAGDALFFQDSVLHGSVARTNPGYRKTLCFRYNPAETTRFRHAHAPSDALMSRLTPRQRECLTERPNAGDNWGARDGVAKAYFQHHWRGGPQADMTALQQEVERLRALLANSQAGPGPQQAKL